MALLYRRNRIEKYCDIKLTNQKYVINIYMYISLFIVYVINDSKFRKK